MMVDLPLLRQQRCLPRSAEPGAASRRSPPCGGQRHPERGGLPVQQTVTPDRPLTTRAPADLPRTL